MNSSNMIEIWTIPNCRRLSETQFTLQTRREHL